MPSDVFTCTEFPLRLPSILHRHPRATTLVLQLSFIEAPTGVHQNQRGAQDSVATAASTVGWADDASDFVTFYAVLLRHVDCGVDDGEATQPFSDPSWFVANGDPCIEVVSMVVGHASHLNLRWCAQLQHTLSINSLLATSTHPESEAVSVLRSSLHGSREAFTEDNERQTRRSALNGVTALLVRLSPYIPPLQWDRHVDGVLGSQHTLCTSHRCFVSEQDQNGCEAECTSNAARCGEDAEDADAGRRTSVCLSEKPQNAWRGWCVEAPPSQRLRCETSASFALTRAQGTAANHPTSLPFRVAAVLNGNVPLPPKTDFRDSILVLCLVASGGCSLTPTSAPFSFAPNATQSLFDPLCDFLCEEVVPAVSLDVVDGAWACDDTGAVLRDVCKTRGRLGSSFAIRVPGRPDSRTRLGARSITFVVDFSTALSDVLLSSQRGEQTSNQMTKGQTTAASVRVELRCCLARQIAQAMQETLGRLVSVNIDTFSFPLRGRAGDGAASPSSLGDASSPAAELASAKGQVLTREVLCRSIADSVSRIVSLSPHSEFKAEVGRLLWGPDQTGASPCAGRGPGHVQPSASAIQRRIQECLMTLSAE